MKLQEQYDAQRKRYMSNEISHAEFYNWLADEIGITTHDLPFSLDEIRASKDEHLNDLPLAKWDGCDSWVRYKAGQHGMRAWSLSDTVCVLKAYARRKAAEVAAV